MSDTIIMIGEDGKADLYDDTYDITIHCETKEDCDQAMRMLKSMQWIPCSERLPEEDHWLGGSGRQFSDEVLISVENRDDEDAWVYISQTIDGKWILELPRHCEITAWMPLPEPWKEGEAD